MKKVLDLSRFNGTIDFERVKNDGYQNVILQIGWIGNFENHKLDTKFNEYYKQAKLYGFNVGVYVYTYCETIEALSSGMKWIVENLTNKVLELPVFIDYEDEQISNLSKEVLTNQAKYFCDYMQMKGFKSGIYANKNWFTKKLNHSELLNYKIWWAEYNGKSNHTSTQKVDLWQYTSTGKVDGIEGNVDISICYCEDENVGITGNINEDSKTNENINFNKGSDFEVKRYVNGSTREYVYQDSKCTKQIGYLNPREEANCYGLVDNKPLIVYKLDGSDNFKTGFVKWLGGLQN